MTPRRSSPRRVPGSGHMAPVAGREFEALAEHAGAADPEVLVHLRHHAGGGVPEEHSRTGPRGTGPRCGLRPRSPRWCVEGARGPSRRLRPVAAVPRRRWGRRLGPRRRTAAAFRHGKLRRCDLPVPGRLRPFARRRRRGDGRDGPGPAAGRAPRRVGLLRLFRAAVPRIRRRLRRRRRCKPRGDRSPGPFGWAEQLRSLDDMLHAEGAPPHRGGRPAST